MFAYEKKILFGDCDSAGILFFANLFKYMHEAYEFFIAGFGNYDDHFKSEKTAYPVIKAEAEYFSPLELGKTAEIKIFVTRLQESSFELKYEFEIGGETKAIGKTVHVCVDIRTGSKKKLNENLRENLKLHSA